MANSKARCAGCKQYFPQKDLRRVGVQRVCSSDCMRTVAQGMKQQSPTSKAYRPKPVTKNDIPSATRALVMQRDSARCRWCGATAFLELHHIVYRSQGVDHGERNLITLCGDHHRLVHTAVRVYRPLLQETIKMIYDGHSVTVAQVQRWRAI